MTFTFWHHVPFVRFLLPFALGITASLFVELPYVPMGVLFICSISAFLVAHLFLTKYRYALLSGVLLNATLFFFGIALNLHQNELLSPSHFSKMPDAQALIVRVDELPKHKPRSVKIKAKAVMTVDSLGRRSGCTGTLVVYLARDSMAQKVAYGDLLAIRFGSVRETSPPRNPDEFDYKRYLRFHNIFHQAYLRGNEYRITGTNKANPLFAWVYGVQNHFQRVLETNITSHCETAVAQALLYGEDDHIDPQVVQAYANTGTLHVLAVSGMHVGIIFMVLGWLLTFMNRSLRLVMMRNIIILCALWVYSLLCGLSPSILRATVMFSFVIVSNMLRRKSNVYNTLAASAFTLMCVDTNMLANVGFQLSYLAVIGIITFHPLIYNWLSPSGRIADEVWKITAVSLAAQLTTFPVGLLYFHQFPNYFLFSNLIIIPLTTGILYAGIVLLSVSWITALAAWIGKLMFWGIWLTNAIVQYVELMPFSFINGIHINIPETVMIYLSLACAIAFLLVKKSVWLRWALICSCGLCILFDMDHFDRSGGRKLVVYDVPGHTSMHLIRENGSLLVLDSTLWADREKVRFHMQQHFWSQGIRQPQCLYTDSSWKLIRFGDRNILLSGEGTPALDPSVHVHLLVIRNKLSKRTLSGIGADHSVITPALRGWQVRRLREALAAQNIPAVYVGDSGAYELSL